MLNAGPYIYLYKKIMETAFYRDSCAVHIAIHLLLKANYRDTKTVFNGQEVIIHRGEHLTGRHVLAEETGIKQSTVRNKLALLKKVGFLDIKSNNRFSIISICKYSEYQESKKHIGQHFGQQLDNNWTTTGQQLDTPNKEVVKEVKEIKEKTCVTENPFPKNKKEEVPKGPPENLKAFAEFKVVYPKQNGKFLEERETFRRFCLIPENDWPLVTQATKNYAESERVKKGVGLRDPKNFLGDLMDLKSKPQHWREWIEPEKKEEPVSEYEKANTCTKCGNTDWQTLTGGICDVCENKIEQKRVALCDGS